MKRHFIEIFFLLVSISLNSQSVWNMTEHPGDKLKGTEYYRSYSYANEKGDKIILWSNEEDYFRIISNSHIFNYNQYKTTLATIGFYDKDENLVENFSMGFIVDDENSRIAHNSTFLKNRKKGEQIVKYLTSEEGYVRIIVDLYNSYSDFDLMIPCFTTATKNSINNLNVYEKIKDGIEQIYEIWDIIGLKDSVSIAKYIDKIKAWTLLNEEMRGLEFITDSEKNRYVIQGKQQIRPELVLIEEKLGDIIITYDIVIDLDPTVYKATRHIENIRLSYNLIPDRNYDSLPVKKFEQYMIERKILDECSNDSGIIDSNFLNKIKKAELDGNLDILNVYVAICQSLVQFNANLVLNFPLY